MTEAARKFRLLFFVRSLGNGGAERQLVVLAIGLHRRGHSIEVATFYPGGVYEDTLKVAGVPVTCLHKGGRWDLFGFFVRLVRLVRARNPDILHSYMTSANIFAALVRPFVAGSAIVWGMRASKVDASVYSWVVAVTLRIEALLSRFIDLIIANSEAGHAFAISAGFPADKITVIHNGIDIDLFRQDRGVRDRFRDLLNVAADRKLVGLIGRIDPMKGHDTFIEAAALVHSRQPDVLFVCVGSGAQNYRAKLKQRAAELGLGEVLLWTGQLDDMCMAYNGIDLMCLTSTGEGFPNVVAEAMACGTDCVVTDVGDAARIVGDMSRVVPVATPQALAEAIESSLANPVAGDHLRAKIATSYSIEQLCNNTIAALRCLPMSRKSDL